MTIEGEYFKMVKNVNFELEEETILQLKNIAKNNERSLSAQLRFIVFSWLKENNSESIETKNKSNIN